MTAKNLKKSKSGMVLCIRILRTGNRFPLHLKEIEKHKQAATAACFFVAEPDTFYKNWRKRLTFIIGYPIITPTIRNKEIPLREQREIRKRKEVMKMIRFLILVVLLVISYPAY